jgi:hypothetical protein
MNSRTVAKLAMLGNRSSYTHTVEGEFICVVDLDVGRSVTNDAENVVADLARIVPGGLKDKRIIYRDSEGTWDEMLLMGGEFAGFRFLGTTNKDEAIEIARCR